MKLLRKVPLRLPLILSSCPLKTMWTRAYPGLFSPILYPVPISCLQLPSPNYPQTLAMPSSSLPGLNLLGSQALLAVPLPP